MLKASKACHKLPPYNKLLVGDRVSVRCDLEALQREGGHASNHSIAKASAHGVEEVEVEDGGHFVATPEPPSKNSVLDYEDNVGAGGPGLKSNVKRQAVASTGSRFRCRGEGATGRNTRFGAFAAPSCHGKWIRLSLDKPKKCTDFHFVFV